MQARQTTVMVLSESGVIALTPARRQPRDAAARCFD